MTIQLLNEDCVNVKLADISCIYLDPPYSSKAEDQYYGVGDTFEEYLGFMKERLKVLKTCMAANSNILIHIDWKASHYLKMICDEIFGRRNFQNEIVWAYDSPSVAKSHLPRKHDVILWYGLGDYAYNQIFVPYKNLSVGGKTSWSPNVNKDDYIKKGKSLTDCWSDIPALCRNEKEKNGWKTQKPLKLMERIVSMFSNESQTIYDPFCGSGSFLEAGVKLNRNVIGVDISSDAIEIAKKRLSLSEQK
jgi:site-specific DNA-methyltransferase (adenine-specific)